MDYTPYLDGRGFPGCRQSDGSWDGGDTAAIMGTIMALSPAITALIIDPLITSLPYDGLAKQPLRYPPAVEWYGQPWRFSRDQLIPTLCGRIATGKPHDLLYLAHKKRWFLTAWNTLNNDGSPKSGPAAWGDICGPEVWALWIRLLNPWWGWLVLWLLDAQTLIGAVQWRWFTPKSFQICRNHMLVSIVMRTRQPSPLSFLVWRINDWPDLIARWRASNEATGEFPTASLFEEAIKVVGSTVPR